MPASPKAAFLANLALAAWSASCLAQAQDVSIRTGRDGEFVTISASAVMRVDPHIAWAVLSDYDHLARFIPDVKSSRVISRHGNVVRVEQTGDIGFLFYKEPVNVIFEVHEEPETRSLNSACRFSCCW